MAKGKHNTAEWSAADRRYGWKLLCDDGLPIKQAAQELGYSVAYLYELKDTPDRSKPGSKAWPLRFAQDPVNGRRMVVCIRSIAEFKRLREPVEV
jgi:hypothetical protein